MSEVLHRKGKAGPIPAFSIECSGYQKGFATLLKEKFERIAKLKENLRGKSMKRKSFSSAKTRKVAKTL
jgi:hypothetical protein